MRMRIMLPFSTIQAFGTDFDVEDITQLINDGSESTEVCILDLEDIFVVEFFRGVGCETRIFTHNSSVEEQLFYSPEICLKRLRYLSVETDEVIDHCYGWQIQLEQVLRSKNIFPNQHQQHFNLEENKQGLNYSKTVGLPTLNSRQMMQRNKELFNWQNDIIRLETEAQKYCQRQEQRGEFDSRFIFKSNSSSRPQKRSHLDFID